MPPKQPPTRRRVNSFTREVAKEVEIARASEKANASDLHTLSAGTLAVPSTIPSKATDRKKASTTRKVLKFDTEGKITTLEANKVSITHQLGVQSRDLRLLDPHMATSYPSAILCREQALVVNMEHIKCVVTRHYLLLLTPEEESVVPFISELQRKLAKPEPSEIASDVPSDAMGSSAASEMPFELRALEVVLDVVSTHLERLASDLEAAAHPALDALTAKVTSHNLERVRRIKNRLVRLTTRVETAREVLEKFLDDDADMKDMNLTAKYEQHLLSLQRKSLEVSFSEREHADTPFKQAASPVHRLESGPFAQWNDSDSDSDSDVDEVEYMLETYFMQMDNTYNKLQTLMEYIDDTEDYINIELDNHRNQIIQLDLVLTTATTAVSIVAAVGSIFGMNLANAPDASIEDGTYWKFLVVTCVSVGACILFFMLVIGTLWRQRLIGF